MTIGKTLVLGLVAGITIVLGMPLGRMVRPAAGARIVLNGTAVGILLFLLWDVFSAAWEPLDEALMAQRVGPSLGYGALFVGGLSLGLLGLVAYDRLLARSFGHGIGPGAQSVAETPRSGGVAAWSPARRLALMIAVGIGLHNFAEGLAIGGAASRDDIALAALLVVGFALHNATEGFGIVAPLVGDVDDNGVPRRPSWTFLLGMALIAGGPTFVGTAIGHQVTWEPVSVVFLTLAAGSILFVVVQLLGIAARARRTDLLACGLLIGLLAGFATDAVVTAAGA